MAKELLSGDYIQADETPIGVQMHDGRGQNHQGYLWQYSRPGGMVIFDFRLSRAREGPKEFLGHFNGILQTDGYSGYERVGGPKLIHAGCWAHARRYFFRAVEAHPDDRTAIRLVATIDELFALEAQAREQNLSLSERDQLRQQNAQSILESIKHQIEVTKGQTLPKSALAKACNYTLSLWNRLTRFLDHPILELSTNAAENAIRPVALGRKNWIHFGSQQAGPRIAAILSITETCRRLLAMLGWRKPSQQSSKGQGPIATLVGDFNQHMTKVCGLSPATRFYRRRYAWEFLLWRFHGKDGI